MSTTMLELFDTVAVFPRARILASAGSGKTFRISSEIIALLARGEAPDEIFASTFTRKAAGEILERVLVRLATAALDADEARNLADSARLLSDRPDARAIEEYGCAFWGGQLERAVKGLHRINIGTLDAFFLRTAGVLAQELGLPPEWQIADEVTSARLRSLALQDVLRGHGAGVLLPLVQSISRSPLTRSIHDGLLRKLRVLLAVHYALDPATTGHWSGFDREATGVTEAEMATERRRLAAAVAALEPPCGKSTRKPLANYVTGLANMRAAIEVGDWVEFVGLTLVERVRAGEEFCSVEVPPDIAAVVDEAWALARRDTALRMARRSHALGEFARLYADALERRRIEAGAYGFDDITRLLGEGDLPDRCADIYYRLDARSKHILLDEFQDTSVPQWRALAPFADELLSGHEDERAAVVVADPKQSIYGWRGGTPDLVREIGRRYVLRDEVLPKSWRSSSVILDFVNDVFGRLGDTAAWNGEECPGIARDWLLEFEPHQAAKQLSGHVVVRVGPRDEGSGEARPNLMRAAARAVAELHEATPGRSIGVLTRTNAAVARMMLNLRDLGVHASEEGGNPLTDAAPVTAILALLRMCDNPGNAVARYHVAHTPLGPAIGYTDHGDRDATCAVTAQLRLRLLDDGYGATIAGLAALLEHACDPRERRRLAQLTELAFRYDAAAGLRPSDFVRLVREERVEDPVAAGVRVMTVHQAKGLEFDIVVLPELDAPLVRGRYMDVLAYRPSPGAPVTRAFPFVGKAMRALFPSLEELTHACEQAFRNELRDGLSTLYVALTRARHALHIIVRPNQGTGDSGARVLLRALCPGRTEFAEGDTAFESGCPDWHAAAEPVGSTESAGPASDAAAGSAAPAADAAPARDAAAVGSAASAGDAAPAGPVTPGRIGLRAAAGRSRMLPRRTPSQLEGDGRVDLGLVLRLTPAAARGSVAHRWFENTGWLEDGVPTDDALRTLAAELDAGLSDAELHALITEFRGWLTEPRTVALLSRASWPAGAEVQREVPFLVREGDALVEGFIDRLIMTRDADGRVTGAAVIDYKTDVVSSAADVAQRTSHYRPQIDAYRRAVSAMHGIPAQVIGGWLVFLHGCAVVELEPAS